MTERHEGIFIITCDKCKTASRADEDSYNEVFFYEGWILNRGRKYKHLCRHCQTPKQRKAHDFVKEKFMNN